MGSKTTLDPTQFHCVETKTFFKKIKNKAGEAKKDMRVNK